MAIRKTRGLKSRPSTCLATFIAMAFLSALLIATVPNAAMAQGPRPPCGVAPVPAFPETGEDPAVRVWRDDRILAQWPGPDCVGGVIDNPSRLVALSGAFRHEGGTEPLAARFGAISRTQGTQYWSVTDQTWKTLITGAHALTGPDGERRADFSAAEVTSGEPLYFAQADNRSSGLVTWRMRGKTTTADRLVIEMQNVTPVTLLGLTLFPANSLKSVYFLDRTSPDTWTFYGLAMIGEQSIPWPRVPDASYINRAVAEYRHFIGIPTDQEPPAARN